MNKEDREGNVYNNILTKAAIVGDNGGFWAFTSNFHLTPYDFEIIKKVFKQKMKMNKNDKISLEDREYKIVNIEENLSIDFEDGEFGGTIDKTNNCFIFGFFNKKINCWIKGEKHKHKQNLKLCNKVVEQTAAILKNQGY